MTAARGAVAVLLTLMRQLQEVMRTENGLLRDMRLERLRALQAEKAALADAYEVELRRLRDAPDAGGRAGAERSGGRWTRPCGASARPSRRTRVGWTPPAGSSKAWSRRWARAWRQAQRPARYRPGAADRGGALVVSLALNHRV